MRTRRFRPTELVLGARRAARRGSALVMSLVVVSILATVASAALLMHTRQGQEIAAIGNRTRALYAAETGVNETILALAAAVKSGGTVPTGLGNPGAPIAVDGGRYWSTVTDNTDGTFDVVAHGRSNLARRGVRVVLTPVKNVFDHAVFAGNSSEDPTYTMTFGGDGVQADSVTGDIHSGGDIDITGDASIVGELSSSGTITGGTGTENLALSIPDLDGPDYANNNDVDVADLFSSATWESSVLGGSAYQMPESSPAHIFRKNPDDRTSETGATAKDDYFLEDPYMPVEDFTDPTWGDGHTISLSGATGYPGSSGSDKVYYIDGNLWIHNYQFLQLRFHDSGTQSAKVTFVVEGNIYFSDGVMMDDPATDGVAFIAMEDDAEPDSGNIYLGDPMYGTLEYIEAYLYAENDFIDNNLDEAGSKTVTIKGNMTAGNHVDIERDYIDGGTVEHSKLTVLFDDRVSTGALELPALPEPAAGVEGFTVAFWAEVASN